jgi:two-component system response regulator
LTARQQVAIFYFTLDGKGNRMTERVILLVEDNPDDELLTLRAMKKHNIVNKVTVARDGAEALEHLFADGDAGRTLPGLILLDLKLPKVDGLEVLRRIRDDERTKLVPVVVLTSSKQQEDILASYRLGVNAYVRKPVKFSEFAEAVSTLGLFWLLLNETADDTVARSD